MVFFLTVEGDEGRKDPSERWSEKEFGPVQIEGYLYWEYNDVLLLL